MQIFRWVLVYNSAPFDSQKCPVELYGLELLARRMCKYLILIDIVKLPSGSLHQWTLPSTMCDSTIPFFHSCQLNMLSFFFFLAIKLFYLCLSDGQKIVCHCYFNLHFISYEWNLSMFLFQSNGSKTIWISFPIVYALYPVLIDCQ